MDIGNAYLEAYTEMVYIVAGKEFGDLCGHTLIIHKALYGLRSSGLRWWERLSVVLKEMVFAPSKAESDIWIHDCGDHYEYLARYVDDLGIISKRPREITDALEKEHGFKLKGTGPITYHLGSNFFRDSKGVLCMAPKKYIDRMSEIYLRLFGTKPRTTFTSPLEKGDHPELDTSPELGAKGIKQYQSLIGAAQWAVSLGRLDIATVVMTLSSFCAAPREGHLSRIRRVFGYLVKMKHATIRFRTGMPDYSGVPIVEHE